MLKRTYALSDFSKSNVETALNLRRHVKINRWHVEVNVPPVDFDVGLGRIAERVATATAVTCSHVYVPLLGRCLC